MVAGGVWHILGQKKIWPLFLANCGKFWPGVAKNFFFAKKFFFAIFWSKINVLTKKNFFSGQKFFLDIEKILPKIRFLCQKCPFWPNLAKKWVLGPKIGVFGSKSWPKLRFFEFGHFGTKNPPRNHFFGQNGDLGAKF